MKKQIFTVLSIVAIAATVSSCMKVKDYKCECTYVASTLGPNAGKPNRVETEMVKGRTHEMADVECGFLESKYNTEFYSGTCLLK